MHVSIPREIFFTHTWFTSIGVQRGAYAFYNLPRINEPNGGAHFHHPTPATLVLGRKKERIKNSIYSTVSKHRNLKSNQSNIERQAVVWINGRCFCQMRCFPVLQLLNINYISM